MQENPSVDVLMTDVVTSQNKQTNYCPWCYQLEPSTVPIIG